MRSTSTLCEGRAMSKVDEARKALVDEVDGFGGTDKTLVAIDALIAAVREEERSARKTTSDNTQELLAGFDAAIRADERARAREEIATVAKDLWLYVDGFSDWAKDFRLWVEHLAQLSSEPETAIRPKWLSHKEEA